MSAKATYAKPPVNLPPVPPELWITILRFATEIPEVLDVTQSLFRFPGETKNGIVKLKKSYKSALTTKRRLLLVCKDWKDLATPFLYEHLVLENCHTLPLLFRTLSSSRHKSLSDSRVGNPVGWWTKRLDVFLRDDDVVSDVDATRKTGDILFYLPNVATITFCAGDYWNYNLPPTFISALQKIGSNIRVLNWQSLGFSPKLGTHHFTFTSTPNLTSLQLHWLAFTGNPVLSLPVLPRLQSLSLVRVNDPIIFSTSLEEPMLMTNLFPSLTQIKLVPAQLVDDHHVRTILRLCSSTISSVYLSSDDSTEWGATLDSLYSIHSSMTFLTLHSCRLMTDFDFHLPPSVRVLALSSTIVQAQNWVYSSLKESLPDLKGDGLKTVVIDDKNARDFRDKHRAAAQALIKALGEKGRRLVFGEASL
ncbi:hypothetical protein VKT23_018006 [Stygiomarasmius scandens]|uniref:F-box domain-containing protein n=1 Tax=Marasmiellus scandens TaxID=2682957 RepID=A0ABR1IQ87_9AGAR